MTSLLAPALRAAPLARLLRVVPVAITLAALALVYSVTVSTAAGDRRVGLLLLGVLGLLTTLLRPRAAVFVLLLLTDTFFLVPLGPISFAGIRSDVAELLAGVLILAFAGRAARRGPAQLMPVLGLSMLTGAVLVGALWSLVHGGARADIVGDAKSYGFYLLALPMAALFADEDHKQQLERWVLGICTVCGLLTLLAVATHYPLQGRPGVALDLRDVTQAARIRPALLPLLFLATLLLTSRIMTRGWTLGRACALATYLAVWGVSFNRSSWVALAGACALFGLFRRGPRRPLRFVTGLLMTAVLLPTLFLSAAHGTFGVTAAAVSQRVTTIGQPRTFSSSDNSFQDRKREYDEARRALTASPLLGVGVGHSYGARLSEYDPGLNAVIYRPRLFSHNSLLYLYLQTGLLGLAALVMLVGQLGRRCWRAVVEQPLPAAGRAAAAGFALVGALLEALANPNLLARASVVAFAVAVPLMLPSVSSQHRERAAL